MKLLPICVRELAKLNPDSKKLTPPIIAEIIMNAPRIDVIRTPLWLDHFERDLIATNDKISKKNPSDVSQEVTSHI